MPLPDVDVTETERVSAPRLTPRERVHAALVSVTLLGATLWPVTWELGRDSFPLSSYPMFSRARGRELALVHAVGIDADGARSPLSPRITARTFEVLQSMATLRQAVHGGRADALCREIAERVAVDESLSTFVAVEIATDTFDTIAYFEEDRRDALASTPHARCDVVRGGRP